jgi:F-type H+-transporting ATPase subunit epsilon
MLHLKIITPRHVVHDEKATAVTLPGADGEMTILPHHAHALSLLKEGIITIKNGEHEDFLAIGGGYMETDGKSVTVLVSRAYRQDEINKELTEQALEKAKQVLAETKDSESRYEALATIRRSTIDLKLLRKRRRNTPLG